MKKLLIYLLFSFCTAITFSQTTFKFGLLNSLGIDKVVQDKAILGSVIGEINYKVTGMISPVLNIGILRFEGQGEGFNMIPVLLGTKHQLDETFYFGGNAGASWFLQNRGGSCFTWSGYFGANIKEHFSADLRYLNAVRSFQPIKTIALVISYNF